MTLLDMLCFVLPLTMSVMYFLDGDLNATVAYGVAGLAALLWMRERQTRLQHDDDMTKLLLKLEAKGMIRFVGRDAPEETK